jgi:hypothetical protein
MGASAMILRQAYLGPKFFFRSLFKSEIFFLELISVNSRNLYLAATFTCLRLVNLLYTSTLWCILEGLIVTGAIRAFSAK